MPKTCVEQGERKGDRREDAKQGRDDAQNEILAEEIETDRQTAFKDDEDEADVSEREEGLLPADGQDVGNRHAVNQADDDLADEAGAEHLVGEPFRDAQEQEEGDEREDADDLRTIRVELRLRNTGDILSGSWYSKKTLLSPAIFARLLAEI